MRALRRHLTPTPLNRDCTPRRETRGIRDDPELRLDMMTTAVADGWETVAKGIATRCRKPARGANTVEKKYYWCVPRVLWWYAVEPTGTWWPDAWRRRQVHVHAAGVGPLV